MWFLPLLLVSVADARSTGLYLKADQFACDFDGSTSLWGCQSNQWNASVNFLPTIIRAYCMDATGNGGGKIMWWVGAPKSANGQFTLRTGDGAPAADPTTYVPGAYLSIYIRQTQFDTPFKGLLLYAKNSSNQKVGNWILDYEQDPNFATFPISICPQTVMHINAEDKNIVNRFVLATPPKGSGTITIHAMLKTGAPNPTNYGDFLKLPIVTLTEDPGTTVPAGRYVALSGSQSCADYCTSVSQPACSDAALSANLDGFNPKPFDEIFPCHSALFNDNGNPRADLSTPSNFCYHHGPGTPTGASCTKVPDASTTLFCVCGAPITPAPTGPPTAGNCPPGTVCSPAPRLAPGFAAMMSLLFLGTFAKSHSQTFVASMLLLSLMPFASAHNWLEGTRGRAYYLGANQFCSPTFPQLNRNEIHMQVGVKQDFVVEWASAHEDYTYFIVIHDDARDNASKLTRQIMDGWLAGCPGGGFANVTGTTNMKYHRFRPNQNLASTTLVNVQGGSNTMTYSQTFQPNPIYSGSVWNSFSINGQRPATFYQPNPGSLAVAKTQSGDLYTLPFNASLFPNSMLAEYKPSFLLNDRRCSYTNASYPWIETIHRYAHSDVTTALATATLRIEARSGPGRYQVHYKWASYCDVMDVDVQASTILQPYGVLINATSVVYDIGQHCFFPNPRQVGQCIEVVTTPQQCQAICAADTNCKGFQLFPLQLDTSNGNSYGEFPQNSYVPWGQNTSWCDLKQFANTPANGSMICMPIIQFQNDLNSARPLWAFTNDLDHQGFYSTCYIKPRAVNFTNPGQVNVDVDNTFRFGSKCIPCDNLGMDPTNPRWGPQQDYCVDCTKNPTPSKSYNLPTTWTLVPVANRNGTFTQPAHWLSPGGSPYAQQDECRALAKRDPTCSKFVMYSQTRANRMANTPKTYYTNTSQGSMYTLTSTAGGALHYNNNTWKNNYYRNCACLDATVVLGAGVYPDIDNTQTALACDGVSAAQCVTRGFLVYQLP